LQDASSSKYCSNAASRESGKVGRASGRPCFRQFNSEVGVLGILSRAAMPDVGDYGF